MVPKKDQGSGYVSKRAAFRYTSLAMRRGNTVVVDGSCCGRPGSLPRRTPSSSCCTPGAGWDALWQQPCGTCWSIGQGLFCPGCTLRGTLHVQERVGDTESRDASERRREA